MNRIDRLFGILLMLSARQPVRAQDIAARFEISERTVYRDIAALSELGVPVVGQAGEGYALLEGFYLPPLVFTPAEASAVFLGVNMLKASGNLPTDAESVLHKLAAALPKRTLQTATRQAAMIEFYIPKGQFDLNDPKLSALQTAILDQRVVFIRYHSWSERATTEREVEPLSLTYGSGAWYFSAYCRLRQGIRAFRLDRVEMLKVLREHFSGEHAAQTSPAIPMSVEIRFPEGAARWVRERQHYAFLRETAAEPGFILMMYQVTRLDEIKHWLLSWGAEAEVIAPAPLRQMLRDEATKLLVLLT